MTPQPLLPIAPRALLAGARRKESALIALTEELARLESPTDEPARVAEVLSLLADKSTALGGRSKLHKLKGSGGALEVHFGPRHRRGAEGRVLLLGHADTVWPTGTLTTMALHQAEGKLWGPGVLDMKAGLAMALTAIELLNEAELLNREIVLLITSDEETGSTTSRPLIEKLAAECSAVYVLEAAQGLALKTARKGTGNWRIAVQGIAAHAGVDFDKGANALLELARQIERISSWSDPKTGLTVNVGIAAGGTKTNVVAASAWAEIDVRISRKADGSRITRRFASLKPFDKRCQLTITGGINRPPMERTRGTVRLFKQAQALGSALGLELSEASTGGASDGNFTSALGIPTLDGLGAVGTGAHAPHESLELKHLAPRTALLAALLAASHTAGAPVTLATKPTRSLK